MTFQLHQKPCKVNLVRSSRRTVEAMDRRRTSFQKVVKNEKKLEVTYSETKAFQDRYDELVCKAIKQIRKEQKFLWHCQINIAHRNMILNPNDFW